MQSSAGASSSGRVGAIVLRAWAIVGALVSWLGAAWAWLAYQVLHTTPREQAGNGTGLAALFLLSLFVAVGLALHGALATVLCAALARRRAWIVLAALQVALLIATIGVTVVVLSAITGE